MEEEDEEGGGGRRRTRRRRAERESSFKDSPTRVRAYPTSLRGAQLFIKGGKKYGSNHREGL